MRWILVLQFQDDLIPYDRREENLTFKKVESLFIPKNGLGDMT